MAVGGCFKCMKYTLVAFNFLVLCIGGAVLGLGIYTKVTNFGFDKLSSILGGEELYRIGVILLIVGGCVTIVISALGCLGACMENRCMLGIYFTIMLLLTLFFIAVTIVGFIFKDRVLTTVKDEAELILKNKYSIAEYPDVTKQWNIVQTDLKCCGVTGDRFGNKTWAIWRESQWFKLQPSSGYADSVGYQYVPDSCCNLTASLLKCTGQDVSYNDREPKKDPPIAPGTPVNDALHTKGCYDILYDYITQNAAIIGGIAVAAFCILIGGMIFSMCLCCEIGRKDGYVV